MFLDSRSFNLNKLYSSLVEAKIWGVASKALAKPSPPLFYPEYTKPGGTEYVYRELEFWTSGFFPGSLYLLLERRRKYNGVLVRASPSDLHETQLEFACKWWTENLHQNAHLGTTHDLGFMIAPWAKLAWELNRDYKAFDTLQSSAKMLLSRFSDKVGLIRSWDTCTTKRYSFQSPEVDFMTVIDNMMNLDLLFYMAAQTGNQSMYDAAVQHARTTQRTHLRADFSTIHLVVFDPATGDVTQRLTNQGYTDTSCWTRGQTWAIAGFAETYHWTRDESFLATARSCADLFLRRLPPSFIPPWDFDAVTEEENGEGSKEPPDVSAAMIAAYGMLLIHKAMSALGEKSEYLLAALRITEAVCGSHMNKAARFETRTEEIQTVEHGPVQDASVLGVDMGFGETILNGATINNHEFAPRRWADHGLVYADYYFLLVGNLLLEMGVGELIVENVLQKAKRNEVST
ncbi:glycoside hydrolase family 88 protein [Pseudomassariella vexata]|uniref:Glycoside hydrolase family 88 protein n=1 Tax=Pseudomassariella vexata TaxID=1141098 RepID=A0A1Y2DMW2_9PEZI|nr:glycoside hydrolase family 88 protein [Pseudomassariella vexata]ORY60509.1 glycoside hydrolase family 88 protein [Pseudomassariella vexata]